MAKKKAETPVESAPKRPLERFVRIVQHPLRADQTFYEFQTELLEIYEGGVIKRRMVGKPDLFEYAMAYASDWLDPRNDSTPEGEMLLADSDVVPPPAPEFEEAAS